MHKGLLQYPCLLRPAAKSGGCVVGTKRPRRGSWPRLRAFRACRLARELFARPRNALGIAAAPALRPRLGPRARIVLLSLLAIAALAVNSRQAFAHRVKVYAWSEAGNTIRGEVYFPGGGKAKNVTVEVYAPGDRKLGETKTDDAGGFVFRARYHCDHKFVVNIGDGHGATYVLKADELPRSLPALQGAGAHADQAPTAEAASAQQPATAPDDISPAAQRLVEEAIIRQVVPLRRQIEAYEEKVRLRDVVGGIGYIVGIAGIVFYFKASAKFRAERKE